MWTNLNYLRSLVKIGLELDYGEKKPDNVNIDELFTTTCTFS